MEISKGDFERAISLAYQRGRVTPIRFIEQSEIDSCIADIYELLDQAQQEDSVDNKLPKCTCGNSFSGEHTPSCPWH